MKSRQRQHAAAASRKDGYHHGDLRRALLAAAVRLLEQDGAAALSLREVARAAGVTHAAPYRHFESREALLAAVAAEGFELLKVSMERKAARTRTPRARLHAIGDGYVAFAAEHPVHFGVMFQSIAGETAEHPALQQCAGSAFELLVASVRACQASGDARKGDPFELALGAWFMVHGAAMLRAQNVVPPGMKELSLAHISRTLETSLLEGIR